MTYTQTIDRSTHSKKEQISYFNILIVGATNSGKTSFVRTFCEILKPIVIRGTFKESKDKILLGSLKRTDEIYTVSMEIEQDERRTALSITDTPGLLPVPEMTEELKAVANHINDQYARTFSEEFKVRRNLKVSDTQVHVCLYFLSSFVKSHLSSLDRYAISILSSQTNVVPIIGKADKIAMAQVAHLKYIIKNEFFNSSGLCVYGHFDMGCADETDDTNFFRVIDMFEKSLAKEEDVDDYAMVDYLQHMPYTTISHEEDYSLNAPGSRLVQLGRRYPWSFVECCNPAHCDLLLLKKMLLSTHIDMLKADTFELFYESYRSKQLLESQNIQVSETFSPSR
ncbi:hypothetical protein G6F56_008273 [Rhizopus delemar]|nr:hypothetical protein G6F56_008273 [Rhizopus delemar]